MLAKRLKVLVLAILAIILIVILLISFFPTPVNADGGLLVPHDLWADMEEGHQIGVLTIINDDETSTDLFISILDRTPVSHEVTFFVPIGKNATNFTAYEEDLLAFDKRVTTPLDKILRDSANSRMKAVQALFSGALLTNGAILTPAWAPLLLTGCGAVAQQPEVTIQTESSDISVYSINDDTDIEELIRTTGLAPSVADTLSGLRGEKVAIVNLQTQVGKVDVSEEVRNYGGNAYAEPGLHLNWKNQLVENGKGKTVSYPLGTGGAWAKPIELTRVYVRAYKGQDFKVEYPRLGENHSGYDFIAGTKIREFTVIPAYAVDEARGDFGHIWRATYTQSNPTENVIITVKPESMISRFLAAMEGEAFGYSVIFAIFIGIAVWVLAFRLLMPVFVGKNAEYAIPAWYEGLIYPGINLGFLLFPGSILWGVFILGAPAIALTIQCVIGAGISIGIFMGIHSKRFGASRGKALRAFILTSLCGSAAYLILATGFAFLVNAV